MVVLFNCKNKEDPMEHEGTRVATRLNFDFSYAQGQLIVVSGGIGRNLNSSKLLCLFSLTARM